MTASRNQEEVDVVRASLARVQARIAAACDAAGRDRASVRLLAASKGQAPDAIRAAYAAGQRAFGENYVQELARKAEALRDLEDLEWHFIGHLQRNKVKEVLAIRCAIDTVDSGRLADAIAQRAAAARRVVDVRIEVNVGDEPQKAGVSVEALEALVRRVRGHAELRLCGLLAIPPAASSHPESSRPYFRGLRDLGAKLGLSDLSMGMSHDLEIAIEEGATEVRVGTAIFGERD